MQTLLIDDIEEAFDITPLRGRAHNSPARSVVDGAAQTCDSPAGTWLTIKLDGERRTPAQTCQIGPQPSIVRDGMGILDDAYSLMFEGRTADGVKALVDGLGSLRARFASMPDDYRYFAQSICRTHPIADLIRQDPLSIAIRAGRKNLLDYIHDNQEPVGVSMTGRSLAAQTSQIDLVRSLRSRRSILAQRIDEAAAHGNARILVLGAGSFHEGRLSRIIRAGRYEELVLVDEDAQVLQSAKPEFTTGEESNLRTVQATVRALLSRSVEFSGFDIVIAPALFDTLADAEARRLAETMFTMLKPGGRAILVNAGDTLADSAFREAFLGWSVNSRSEADLVALTSAIPSKLIGQVRLYRDEYGISNFVELFRR